MPGLDKAFACIGARVCISPSPTVRVGVRPGGTFLLELPGDAEALALSIVPRARHPPCLFGIRRTTAFCEGTTSGCGSLRDSLGLPAPLRSTRRSKP